MKHLFFLLMTLAIVKAGVVPEPAAEEEKKCEGIIIEGNCYDKEILKSGLDRPYLLAVDYNTNTVYFSYNVNENDSKSARYDLDLKEFKNIDDVPHGFAQTVDQNTSAVYIGGYQGVYKYDRKSHKSELYITNEYYIWRVFFKDILYFADYPAQLINTFIDGSVERFKDLEDKKIDEFLIDNEDDIFYTDDSGLYSQKKGCKDSVLYKDAKDIRVLALDIHGNVYACSTDNVYKVDKKNTSIKKLLDVDDCFGIAFDGENNMIYSDAQSLVRLKLNKDKIY